jgi:hypothetical protein
LTIEGPQIAESAPVDTADAAASAALNVTVPLTVAGAETLATAYLLDGAAMITSPGESTVSPPAEVAPARRGVPPVASPLQASAISSAHRAVEDLRIDIKAIAACGTLVGLK